MKYNKGFATLAILGIVLGVLIVGGGAYYLNTKNTSKEIKQNNLDTQLKSNIEKFLSNGRYKPNNGDTLSFNIKLYGYENNYAYTFISYSEFDANGKLVTGGNFPARFTYDSSYNITSYTEASDGESFSSSIKKLFSEKYYDLLMNDISSGTIGNKIIQNNDDKIVSGCDSTSTPSLTIISPNGGETYKIGDSVKLKWKSCNLSSSTYLRAALVRQPPFPDGEWQIPILFGNVEDGRIKSAINDGEQVVTLDSTHNVVPASYKLCISEYSTAPGQSIIQGCSNDAFTINSNLEDSNIEIFKNQPGAIKSITPNGDNKWILSIDLLSHNHNWIPGVDSTGGFFLNQSTKIRNLNINSNTIINNCTSQSPDYYSGFDNNSLSFVNHVQDLINKSKTDPGVVGEFGYTAYFDITGTDITAVYEQCLP